jgi:hypothetical protein
MANTTDHRIYESSYRLGRRITRESAVFYSTVRRSGGGVRREPYPTNRQVMYRSSNWPQRIQHAEDLYEVDVLWSAAMLSDVSINRRANNRTESNDPFMNRVFELGLYDLVVDDEDRNLVKAMRYAAVCASFVMDHVDVLERQVCARLIIHPVNQ